MINYDSLHNWLLDQEGSYLREGEEAREVKEYVVQHLPKTASTIELGAGGGFFSQWLVAQGYKNVTATDYSQKALDIVKERFPGVRCKRMDAQHVSGGLYDCVVALDLIEHLTDTSTHLASVYETLRPGGIYIIKTPNKLWEMLYYKHLLLRRDTEKKHPWWHGHISLMSYWSLQRRCKRAGFTVRFLRQKRLT